MTPQAISRCKHFLYAIPIGATLSVLCAIGVASGLEYKDAAYGNRWDWWDWLCTVAGGVVGNGITAVLIICLTPK